MSQLRTKLCRLCLEKITDSDICYSLLEEERSNILESLTSLKVREEKQFPTDACVKCWLNVNLAYRIQQNILKVTKKLPLVLIELKKGEKTTSTSSTSEKPESTHGSVDNNDDNVEGDNDDLDDEVDEPEPVQIKQELCMEINAIKQENIVDDIDLKEDNLSYTEVTMMCDQTDVSIKTEDSQTYKDCKICGECIADEVYFEHVKDHYYTRIQCEECDVFCENIKAYHDHAFTKHAETQKFWHCPLCDSIFRYKPLWKIHVEKAHDGKIPGGERFDCTYCKRVFHNEQKFSEHMKTHDKKECPICGSKVAASYFRKHVEWHSSQPAICDICGRTYKNPSSLRSHMQHSHSNRTFACKICKKVFKKSYNLNLHEKKEHTGIKDHICDICGKGFFTMQFLNRHKRMTHMKLRPFTCQYCKKKFSSKHAMVTHERQHTNETPYKCEVCGEGFRQNVSLKAHKKSKHNIVQPETCECKVCGKKFSSRFGIVSHMRLH